MNRNCLYCVANTVGKNIAKMGKRNRYSFKKRNRFAQKNNTDTKNDWKQRTTYFLTLEPEDWDEDVNDKIPVTISRGKKGT